MPPKTEASVKGPKKPSPPKNKQEKPKKESPSRDSKKNSPKKGGKKGKAGADESGDPAPLEEVVHKEPANICLFCCKTFSSAVNIQSHLMAMDHFIPEAPIHQRCKVCSLMIHMKDLESHQCCRNKAVFLDQILTTNSMQHGSPNICIYCHGLRLNSKASLITHLLSVHSPNKDSQRCGMCSFQHAELQTPPPLEDKPAEEEQTEKKDDSAEEVPAKPVCTVKPVAMNEDFSKHIETEHDPGIEIIIRKAVAEDGQLRYPYACPFCHILLKSNASFHSHILGRHAVAQRYQEDLLECLLCHKPKWKPESLNQHIEIHHQGEVKRLGEKLVKHGAITNAVDLSTTCTSCWTIFSTDFYLQNHIIVVHASRNPFVCGWCQLDFRLVGDFKSTAKEMRKHEREHARTIHLRALEFKLTTEEPPPEEVEEDDALEEKAADGKGSKKNSPKKNSPKKDSPKKDAQGGKGKKTEAKKPGSAQKEVKKGK